MCLLRKRDKYGYSAYVYTQKGLDYEFIQTVANALTKHQQDYPFTSRQTYGMSVKTILRLITCQYI